jgi:hypothetical protein
MGSSHPLGTERTRWLAKHKQATTHSHYAFAADRFVEQITTDRVNLPTRARSIDLHIIDFERRVLIIPAVAPAQQISVSDIVTICGRV